MPLRLDNRSGAMPQKMLLLPELVHTPEPPSWERSSEAGGWEIEHAGEGRNAIANGKAQQCQGQENGKAQKQA